MRTTRKFTAIYARTSVEEETSGYDRPDKVSIDQQVEDAQELLQEEKGVPKQVEI